MREMKAIPAASALIRRVNEILLIQRKYPPSQGKWALPGGIVKQDESMEQAAIREVKEELGIEIEIKRLIGVYNATSRNSSGKLKYSYDIHCYEARHKAGDLKPSPEIMDWKWIKSKAEVADLTLTSTTRKALEDAGFLTDK